MNKEKLLGALTELLNKAFSEDADLSKAYVESDTDIVKSVLEEERRALFVVLEPQEGVSTTDLHGDTYTAAEVEKACQNYNTHCMKANLYHMVQIEDAIVEQSFITPASFTMEDGRIIKSGSWLQWWFFPEGNEVSEDIWKAVKAGEITGVSIGAKANYQELGENDGAS